ncbi:acylating sulfoacetaldehyde dehydrogenase [Salinisphaera aquimarina]|uniref:Aldehyde dehydrogenase family protein n=1 Tax=Salinisphaera aquimarina TaxID=2094031 RepID=A0ABV7ET52_9GAMM
MTAQASSEASPVAETPEYVSGLIRKARDAMAVFANADQARVDEAVIAAAWSLYKPDRAKALARKAVDSTGIGKTESKVIKNQRKTFGALRDLLRVKSVGVIEELPDLGLVKYAKPVGVVVAVTPSTNPSATPVNKIMFALKGRNAIIIAPSPAGREVTTETIDVVRAELGKIGLPQDLVQVPDAPPSKPLTAELMKQADLVVVTGSQNNVRQAYRSGTPAIGVGAGNVPVIIDESAELDAAADKICASKIFDNATSCSSENSVVIVDSIYDDAIAALEKSGGYLASAFEKDAIQDVLWRDGKLNRDIIARDAPIVAERVGLSGKARDAKFFMVEDEGAGPDHPFSGEKLSLVLTVYRARDFDDACRIVRDVLEFQGKGHSCGIHTQDIGHAEQLAETTDVVRVLVNQAHTFGNGGSFDNGLNFTLSMGCGTWAGNSISENLNYRNFINITHLVQTIPADEPSEQELFGAYWSRYGK